VRGLQSHGVPVETAAPGVRTAVNLQGVDLAEVRRGDLLAAADGLLPTHVFDASLHWLSAAPPLAERTSVELLAGTAERRARVSPIGAALLAPGASGPARVHVQGEPLALVPGDRFVVRGFARTDTGGRTLGGGRVLDAAPPHRRLSDPALARDLATLARAEPESEVAVRVARAGLAGAAFADLVRETGRGRERVREALEALRAAGGAAPTTADRWLAAESLRDLEARIAAALAAFHAAEPLRPGMPHAALLGALPANVPSDAAELALARGAEAGALALEGDLARAAAHRVALSDADGALAERVVAEARAAGLEPPLLREWSERLGVAPERLRELLAHLVRAGRLVRAPGEVWFDAEAVAVLRARVVAHLEAHGSLATPAYKDLIGTTRKWAVPLMELFDEEKLTLRRGETRVLRGRRDA
jgi:selenocysteine-specific elongation factor